MAKKSIASLDGKGVCVCAKMGHRWGGGGSHLKVMKNLTAGEDRNDNVCATNHVLQLCLAFNSPLYSVLPL